MRIQLGAADHRFATTDDLRWASELPPPSSDGRNIMLVVAEEPLRRAIVDRATANHYQVLTAATPLDAIQAVQRYDGRIVCAVLSSTPSWGRDLRALLAQEHPHVRSIMLVG